MINGSSINQLKEIIIKREAERDMLRGQLQEHTDTLIEVKDEIDVIAKAQALLQKTSEYARELMRQQIEFIVTNALQTVFEQDYKFVVEMGSKGGSSSAEFYVVTPDGIKSKPMDSHGGGLVDVISTALKVAVLQLYQPVLDGPVIFDEPAKHVSAEYVENIGFFLKEFGKQAGRQVIIVTHIHHLKEIADKKFHNSIFNGISEVTEQ